VSERRSYEIRIIRSDLPEGILVVCTKVQYVRQAARQTHVCMYLTVLSFSSSSKEHVSCTVLPSHKCLEYMYGKHSPMKQPREDALGKCDRPILKSLLRAMDPDVGSTFSSYGPRSFAPSQSGTVGLDKEGTTADVSGPTLNSSCLLCPSIVWKAGAESVLAAAVSRSEERRPGVVPGFHTGKRVGTLVERSTCLAVHGLKLSIF
jgi:hypothetical protein